MPYPTAIAAAATALAAAISLAGPAVAAPTPANPATEATARAQAAVLQQLTVQGPARLRGRAPRLYRHH